MYIHKQLNVLLQLVRSMLFYLCKLDIYLFFFFGNRLNFLAIHLSPAVFRRAVLAHLRAAQTVVHVWQMAEDMCCCHTGAAENTAAPEEVSVISFFH